MIIQKTVAIVARISQLEQELKSLKANFVPMGELSRITGINRRTLHNYATSGLIKYHSFENKRLYHKDEVINRLGSYTDKKQRGRPLSNSKLLGC